ncbi:hypothetical protein EDB85DRAFT_1886446 [Lactarius pseudohatsudake]|nr:hypothetical protein EDB85DRAFT_1886446 [Lactarius pseudohatsudake]
MSQPPTPISMLQAPATITSKSSSNIEGIFDADQALKSYKKKTKNDLKKHDLFKQLEACDSPAAILAVFQAAQFDFSSTTGDDRLRTALIIMSFRPTSTRKILPTAKLSAENAGNLELTSHRRAVTVASAGLASTPQPSPPVPEPFVSTMPTDFDEESSSPGPGPVPTRTSTKRPGQLSSHIVL